MRISHVADDHEPAPRASQGDTPKSRRRQERRRQVPRYPVPPQETPAEVGMRRAGVTACCLFRVRGLFLGERERERERLGSGVRLAKALFILGAKILVSLIVDGNIDFWI